MIGWQVSAWTMKLLTTRAFCYVDDLLDGFDRLMHSDDAVTGPVNLGNPGEFTMLELAQLVARLQALSGFTHDDGDDALDPALFDDFAGGRFLRVVDRKDKALSPFDTFLGGKGPRCGQVRDSQKDFLFRDDAGEIGSVALVPLGNKADLGFLAIGSHDADRFHPGMSIDFLARLGDLVAGALKRY